MYESSDEEEEEAVDESFGVDTVTATDVPRNAFFVGWRHQRSAAAVDDDDAEEEEEEEEEEPAVVLSSSDVVGDDAAGLSRTTTTDMRETETMATRRGFDENKTSNDPRFVHHVSAKTAVAVVERRPIVNKHNIKKAGGGCPTTALRPLQCDSALETLAIAYSGVYDIVLSNLTQTSRALLAEASPALEAAQITLRPKEPLRRVSATEMLSTVSLLRWGTSRGLSIHSRASDDLTRIAAANGALDVLAELVAMGGRCDAACAAAAAGAGHLCVLKFLRRRKRRLVPTLFGAASSSSSSSSSLSSSSSSSSCDEDEDENLEEASITTTTTTTTTRLRRDEGSSSVVVDDDIDIEEPPLCEWDATAPAAAAAAGHVEVLRWMVRRGRCPTDRTACAAAASRGQTAALRCARFELGCEWDESVAAAAAARGHVDTLDLAVRLGCPWDQAQVVRRGAAAGHLSVVKWARAQALDRNRTRRRIRERTRTRAHRRAVAAAEAAAVAAASAAAEAAAEEETAGARLREAAAAAAAALEAEEESDEDFDFITVAANAAEAGCLRILEYVESEIGSGGDGASTRCFIATKYVMDCAARGGSVSVLSWLRSRGAPFDEHTCANAAGSGHLDALIWLRGLGQRCRWNAMTTTRAANGGHFDVLIWSVENGCAWDENVALRSAAVGRIDILSWALERGCPLPRGRRRALAMIDNLPLSDEQRDELAVVLGVSIRPHTAAAAAAADDNDSDIELELVVQNEAGE